MAKRTVNKSATTGKFVTNATVARHPEGTIQQTVDGQTAPGTTRSASSGRFVKGATGDRHPNGTVEH